MLVGMTGSSPLIDYEWESFFQSEWNRAYSVSVYLVDRDAFFRDYVLIVRE